MSAPWKVAIEQAIRTITTPWCPVEIARFNDQVVRLALFRGQYHWHVHEHEDELFFVYRGRITIQLRGAADLVLQAGEVGVVPRGIEHCPKSEEDSYVLMFEPETLSSEGGKGTSDGSPITSCR